MNLSECIAALADLLDEGKTPHGGSKGLAKKASKPRPPDAYVRHAVVAISGRKGKAGKRVSVDGGHAIARSQGVHGRGPKLPYYQNDKRHKQTPSGRTNIRRHQREKDRYAKDAKYNRMVGRRRAEFEGPWKEDVMTSLSQQLYALVEAAAPVTRWQLSNSTAADRSVFSAVGVTVKQEGKNWILTGDVDLVQEALTRARADRKDKKSGKPLVVAPLRY
jgi:hypothetical protein